MVSLNDLKGPFQPREFCDYQDNLPWSFYFKAPQKINQENKSTLQWSSHRILGLSCCYLAYECLFTLKSSFPTGMVLLLRICLHSSSCCHQIKHFCQAVTTLIMSLTFESLFFPDLFSSRAIFRAICICKQDETADWETGCSAVR